MDQVIHIVEQPQTPFKNGTARDSWWIVVQRFDGKSVAALQKSVNKRAPHKTKSGKVESVSGWLAFFKREGLIEIALS